VLAADTGMGRQLDGVMPVPLQNLLPTSAMQRAKLCQAWLHGQRCRPLTSETIVFTVYIKDDACHPLLDELKDEYLGKVRFPHPFECSNNVDLLKGSSLYGETLTVQHGSDD
jgi:hypothetical protein